MSIGEYLNGQDLEDFVMLPNYDGEENRIIKYLGRRHLEANRDCDRWEFGSGRCSFKGTYHSFIISVCDLFLSFLFCD